MGGRILLTILALVLVFSGCINDKPVCDDPYILVGRDCCLDEDQDRICDKDKVQTSVAETTQVMSTAAPTTEAPTTDAPTTNAPTTSAPTTQAPTTDAPTTNAPTTSAPTTQAPTTAAPTTTTLLLPTCGDGICSSVESSQNCCEDCDCPLNYFCSGSSCIVQPILEGFKLDMKPLFFLCGNGKCDSSETQASCCADCGCPIMQSCQDNKCEMVKFRQIPLIAIPLSSERMISNNQSTSNNVKPQVYEKTIVWYNQVYGKTHIWAYNTGSSNTWQVTDTQAESLPSIYGSRLVWEDHRRPIGDNVDIYYLDMSTQEQGMISPRTGYQQRPMIFQDYIAWTEQSGNTRNVYLFDRSNKKETKVTNENLDQDVLANWAGWLIYTEKKYEGSKSTYKLKAYHIPTKQKSTLYEVEDQDIIGADMHGSKIAFTSGKIHKLHIYVYDVASKLLRKVTDTPAEMSSPSIYNDKVVWADDRDGDFEIYMYDLTKNKETKLTNDAKDQTNPDIWGNIVVYEGKKDGVIGRQIFMQTI